MSLTRHALPAGHPPGSTTKTALCGEMLGDQDLLADADHVDCPACLDPNSTEAIAARYAKQGAHNLAVFELAGDS